MTQTEKIKQLELELENVKLRLSIQEASPRYIPVPQPYPVYPAVRRTPYWEYSPVYNNQPRITCGAVANAAPMPSIQLSNVTI